MNESEGFKGRNVSTREGGTLVQKQSQAAILDANKSGKKETAKDENK